MGNLANDEDPDELQHNDFIRVCTVCFDKYNLQRLKYIII